MIGHRVLMLSSTSAISFGRASVLCPCSPSTSSFTFSNAHSRRNFRSCNSLQSSISRRFSCTASSMVSCLVAATNAFCFSIRFIYLLVHACWSFISLRIFSSYFSASPKPSISIIVVSVSSISQLFLSSSSYSATVAGRLVSCFASSSSPSSSTIPSSNSCHFPVSVSA